MKRLTVILFGFAVIGSLVLGCDEGGSGSDIDLSSPRNSVQSLMEAANNKDADALSQIFADNAEGEFDKYQEGKALDEMEAFFENAEITGVEKAGDTAEVSVAGTGNGDETIEVKKTPNGWRVLGF